MNLRKFTTGLWPQKCLKNKAKNQRGSLNVLFLLSTSALLNSCVEAIVLKSPADQIITIVEGTIANLTANPPLILKVTSPTSTGGVDVNYVVGAKVSILENGTTTINLTEKEEGHYHFPPTFRGTVGATYQLKFTKTNGDVFESSVDKMLSGGTIEKVFQQTEPKGLSDAKGNKTPSFYLYVDTPNDAATQDFFMWDYTIYEKQPTCMSCFGGYYYKDPLPFGRCQADQLMTRNRVTFDYLCEKPCWEIIKSTELVMASDVFYNGKTIKNQLVAKLPIYTLTDALINVNQYAISSEAYKFLDLSRKQGIKTGGLADTPPASLVGNVKCVNKPNENVSGFFVVAGTSQKSHWLLKADAFAMSFPTVGLLPAGRRVNYEPAGMSTVRPPLAPCVVSLTRTNVAPTGWIN